jgi:hypothetical protein
MGVDFLRSKAKPFIKAWDTSRVDLTRRTLFTRDPQATPVSAVARMTGPTSLLVGDEVVVQADGSRLLLVMEHSVRAEVVKPPESVMETIRGCGGYALARVSAAHPAMTLAEVEFL